jgi:surface protein
VEVCGDAACDEPHARFTTTEGVGSEVVRVDEMDEHYIVNWNTGATGAAAGDHYRIRVRVGEIHLAEAEAVIVSTGREAVSIGRDGTLAIVAGQTLPIKVRIETGIPGAVVVAPAEAEIGVGETQAFTASVYDLRGDLLAAASVGWSSSDPGVATVDEDGLATGQAVGEAVITATSGPAAGSALLRVTAAVESKFFLADNGVTIRCPDALPGEKGFVGGVEYEAVNRALLLIRMYTGGNLSRVCTTPVTDMSLLFEATDFNSPDIGHWDTSNVTNMKLMFSKATGFNADISEWDTGSVVNMSGMFGNAILFDQDIGGWDTGNVTSMEGMFFNARAFNQDIGGWDTGNVTSMDRMFQSAVSFNRNLSNWCVSGIWWEPIAFDALATAWTLPNSRPVWGTCPTPEQ